MSSTPGSSHEDIRLLIPDTPNPETSTSRRFQTLLDLLTSDKSDEVDPDQTSTPTRWRAFKERIESTLTGCCGSVSWRHTPPPLMTNDNETDIVVVINLEEETPMPARMNLAEALEAEREFRVSTTEETTTTPERVSLLRLLETAEREEEEEEEEEEDKVVGKGNDGVCCCVCMVRKKGAALIPCGHTFCRICSKQVWVNRGSCPLCNRLIIDILNIF